MISLVLKPGTQGLAVGASEVTKAKPCPHRAYEPANKIITKS